MIFGAMPVGEAGSADAGRNASAHGSPFSLGLKDTAGAAEAVGRIAQAPAPSGGSVRFNIFELGMAPPLPQDVFSRAVRGVADGIGRLVGGMLGIPEATEASQQAPMLVFALRERGIEVSPEGDIAMPNTAEGGAMFADLVVGAHAAGDLSLYPGLYGLQKFRDPRILEAAGFGDAFVTGFLDSADGHARSAGFASLLALWGIAGVSAGARNNSPYHELTRRIQQREAAQQPQQPQQPREFDRPPITLQREDGVYRAREYPPYNPNQSGNSQASGSLARNSQAPGPLARPNQGAPPTAPGPLGTRANTPPAGGAGQQSPTAGGFDAGGVLGPADPTGIARWHAEVQQESIRHTQALDAASRNNEVPALPGVRPPDIGRYNWDQVGDVAREFNAGGPHPEVAIRAPVDRNYGELGSRREVGLLVGSPFALADQVAAMKGSGLIPHDFDLAGAAAQVGVDWNTAIQAEAGARAYGIAAQNPVTLAGNRTYVQPDRTTALQVAQELNRNGSGAAAVAIPVTINREIASGTVSTTGVSHEVWLGFPDQLRHFHDTMSQRGRLAGNPSLSDLAQDAGIGGSLPGRIAAAQDLRAAQAEIAHPTTLFGSTVGVQPDSGSAQREAVNFNRAPDPPEHFQLYVPLIRELSGEGLSPGARGTAHTIYQAPAGNLRGFYDEMVRQGRIPEGVSFDTLLRQSGIEGTYHARIGRAEAEAPVAEAVRDPALQAPASPLPGTEEAGPVTRRDTEAAGGASSPFLSGRSLFNPDPPAMAQAMEAWSARAAEGVATGERLGDVIDAIGADAHDLGQGLFPGTPIAGGYGVARDSGARTTDLTHRLFADALEPTLDFVTRDWANVLDRRTGAPPSFPAGELHERLEAGDPEALSLTHVSSMQTADGETITARIDIEPNEATEGPGYRVTTVYPSDPALIESIREALSERWAEMAGIPQGDPRAVAAAADFYYDYIRLYWHVHGNDEIGTSLVAGYLAEKGFPVTGLNPHTGPSAGAFQNDRESFVRRFADGEYLRFSAPPVAPSDAPIDLSQVLRDAPDGDALIAALASAPPEALRDPALIRQALGALNETGDFVFRVDTRSYEEIEVAGGFRVRDASDPDGGFVYAATDLYAGGGHAHPGGTLYVIRRPPEDQRLGPDVFDFRAESDAWYHEMMESGQPPDLRENPLFDTDQLTPGQQRGLRTHVDNDQIRFARDVSLDEIVLTIVLGPDGRTPVEATPRATDRP